MQQFWLALAQVHSIGPVRLRQLLDTFGSMEAAWFASTDQWSAAGMPMAAIDHHAVLLRQLDPEKLLERVRRLDAWVVTLEDQHYPALLREIEDAPAVLYGRGTLEPGDQRAVAVVGTRRASTYGKEMTTRLVRALAQAGVTIISGLAHGIDVHAHQAALEAGGRTLAVMGSGIDLIYPSEHQAIARQILAAGALLTELPPGTKPERHNFPARNRLISGMTLGTLVIEAPESSGSLQTANLAGEQGRDVFAVPGNVTSPNSQGTNRLIQDGAKLVLNADDILKELNLAQRTYETQQVIKKIVPATPLEAQLLELIHIEPLHVDELSRQCQLSIQEVSGALAVMELKGLVLQVAPMTYQKFDEEIGHG